MKTDQETYIYAEFYLEIYFQFFDISNSLKKLLILHDLPIIKFRSGISFNRKTSEVPVKFSIAKIQFKKILTQLSNK